MLPREPSQARKPPFPFAMMLSPLVMGGGMYLVTGRVYSLMFMLLSPIMMIANQIQGRSNNRKNYKDDLRKYEEQRDQTEDAAFKALTEERGLRRTDAPDPAELLLRLAAVLRRSYRLQDVLPSVALGEAEVDLATGEVRRAGVVTATLTAKEHALAKRLFESRGAIVTTDELCRSVYGDEFGYANALAILVRRLREKVEDDPSHPRWVVTVRGLGYRLLGGGSR